MKATLDRYAASKLGPVDQSRCRPFDPLTSLRFGNRQRRRKRQKPLHLIACVGNMSPCSIDRVAPMILCRPHA
jgi:hypothetical protein